MEQMTSIDPKVDPDCKWCNGYGRVNIGNVCSGFGAELGPYEDCMCITYRKIGMVKNDEGEWYDPKKVTGGFIREPIDITKPEKKKEERLPWTDPRVHP
jgi:hypothetical protein